MIGAARLCTLLLASAGTKRSAGFVWIHPARWRSAASAATQPPYSKATTDPASAPLRRDSVFVDRLRVRAVGGHGGSGAVSTWGSRAKGV